MVFSHARINMTFMTFEQQLTQLLHDAEQALSSSHDPAALEREEKRFLGRKGSITLLLQQLAQSPEADRPRLGHMVNTSKQKLMTLLRERREALTSSPTETAFDPTLPGLPVRHGHRHPLTMTIRRIVEIFRTMGFEVIEGPEVESERYNFDLLNIPPHHPARDLQDTFYVAGGTQRVLRTHTSPVQLRAMETRRPPVRLIVPGRVYRNEATDASHESALFQCEGLVIDQGVRLTDLFGTIDAFLKHFFSADVVTRAQASYFPFVEPGAEITMRCHLCGGKGCSVCKQSGWLELMGCGMVHPTVLKNMRVDPKKYSGFAFGMGVDRLMMLKYRIGDIRMSYTGDLRFLRQFS
ncbi:MAG: phenylalanine--tRNA ligase subunit alpha [bacterium]